MGSTYGPAGITIAVRIGFDDDRSLGAGETGGCAVLPVFKEIALRDEPKNCCEAIAVPPQAYTPLSDKERLCLASCNQYGGRP